MKSKYRERKKKLGLNSCLEARKISDRGIGEGGREGGREREREREREKNEKIYQTDRLLSKCMYSYVGSRSTAATVDAHGFHT